MNIELEELVPVVAELADKYTGKESTSITYEKANQLMGAVLYCIREYERSRDGSRDVFSPENRPDARTIYGLGYELVLQRVKKAQQMYNEIIPDFKFFGNRCYYDTFAKGIPSFFRYYDPRFEPQNHILTMDYPVLIPMTFLKGIDAVDAYVNCARLEQVFLGKLPEDYVFHVLRAYSPDFEDLLINIAAIALRNILGCRMAGKEVNCLGYTTEEAGRLEDYINQCTKEFLQERLKGMIDELVIAGYDGNGALGDYLKEDMDDFCFELKHGAENHHLGMVLALYNRANINLNEPK